VTEEDEAGTENVDYVAYYPRGTKETKTRAEPEILVLLSELMTVPCVAIGGITAENCGPLVEAGADFLCIASGVWNHPGGAAEGVRAVNNAIARHIRRPR